MLVLIDKKGVVQSVHIGYDPAIKATLGKELDALLAGKDLAKEARPTTRRRTRRPRTRAWSRRGPSARLFERRERFQGSFRLRDQPARVVRRARPRRANHADVLAWQAMTT